MDEDLYSLIKENLQLKHELQELKVKYEQLKINNTVIYRILNRKCPVEFLQLYEYEAKMKTRKDIRYSYEHVNDRLYERFNLTISQEEYKNLNSQLKNDKTNMSFVEQEEQEIHKINFKGKLVTFVYSRSRGWITTALKWE